MDQNAKGTIESHLGHNEPFEQEELEKVVGPLKFRHIRDFSFLKSLPNLEDVEIIASHLYDLSSISELKKLKRLNIIACPLSDVRGIEQISGIERLSLIFNLIEEVDPILKLPNLKEAALHGNPWSKDSYEVLRSFYFNRTSLSDHSPILSFSNESSWQITRYFREKEEHVCFSYIDIRPFLIRPGIPSFPNSECDFINVPMAILTIELNNPSFSLSGYFDEFVQQLDEDSTFRNFSYQNQFAHGDHKIALTWIKEASFDKASSQFLEIFVSNFSDSIFFKETENVIKKRAHLKGVELPEWFVNLRKSLTFVLPNFITKVMFDQFEFDDEFLKNQESGWYDMGILGNRLDTSKTLLDDNKELFSIGDHSSGYSILAINLSDPEDKAVYEYSPESWTSEGQLTPGSSRIVFSSYASLLAHIHEILVEGKEVIRKKRSQ